MTKKIIRATAVSSFGLRASFVIFSLLLLASAQAETPAQRVLAEASQAIAENVPQVAIVKLEALLSGNPPAGIRTAASRALAQALVNAGRANDALEYLRAPSDAEAKQLKAQALVALGRWAEALPLFHDIASDVDSPFFENASLAEAEALRALGRLSEAINLLQVLSERKPSALAKLRLADCLLDARQTRKIPQLLASVTPDSALETKWKKYVEGRFLLAQDQAAPALVAFEQILKEPRGLTESLLAGATIGMTEARIVLHGREAADNVLVDFIWRQPESAYLEEMFARLDRLYASEENPPESELQRWSQRPPKRRAALALFYFAKAEQRAKKPEKAVRVLNDFTRQYPNHPLVGDAWMMLGGLHLNAGKLPAAVSAFEAAMRQSPDAESRTRAALALGAAYFRQREFLLAANMFHDAARRSVSSDWLWQQATYNAALASLNMGNYERFFEDYRALSERFPESELRRDLLLEEGLLQARSRDHRAIATLQLFVRDFPFHPRLPEAHVALAEIAFESSDLAVAGKYLKAAYASTPAGQETDRADYLAIFVADAAKDRNDAKVIELCQEFLREHAASPLKAEVRMKLAQVYFRREDFANAQTQFETLASESPASPLVETALFLAGQSSMRSMNTDRALELFEQVAKGSGPLKLYARQEQAIIKTQLGKESEAIILYDDILRAKPVGDVKLSALVGKGDAMVSLAAREAKFFEQAMAALEELVGLPDVPPLWRNQALYKKAKCLEKLDRRDDALATFYEVLASGTNESPEYYWYYRAGFDAARLLEAGESWKAAIGIYEKIARIAGPRAAEAKERANQLRLAHFIWEE